MKCPTCGYPRCEFSGDDFSRGNPKVVVDYACPHGHSFSILESRGVASLRHRGEPYGLVEKPLEEAIRLGCPMAKELMDRVFQSNPLWDSLR